MPKKPIVHRLESATLIKLGAWSLLLNKDNNQIIKEAFALWESNQPEAERKKIDNLLKGSL